MLSVIYRKCIPSHLETKHGQVQNMFNSWHHGRERKKEGTGEGETSRERERINAQETHSALESASGGDVQGPPRDPRVHVC